MAKELAKSYKPSEFEDKIYDFWLEGNYFHAEADPDKKPYTIVMPPPNITGQLHIGHALDTSPVSCISATRSTKPCRIF